MSSKRKSKAKRINPTFYVFCEGKTEEEYIKFLRSKYRVPIEINSKRAGSSISQRFISSYLKTTTTHKKDRVFLMYDLDVAGTLERLISIDGILLVSNPCLELWFLLHFQDQQANLSTTNCLRLLQGVCPNYSKGKLSDNLKTQLIASINLAGQRANQLNRYDNPSTSVNDFISELEKVYESKNSRK